MKKSNSGKGTTEKNMFEKNGSGKNKYPKRTTQGQFWKGKI